MFSLYSSSIRSVELHARLFDNDGLLNQAQALVIVTSTSDIDSVNTVGGVRQLFTYKDYTVVKALQQTYTKDEAG